ncbi:putative nucleotidyltransferase with HDIG domain [Bacillus sp. SORGH_AS 510]|uniref:HD-GYP domain-containing protein n=1 Tax=Bacillus sp. SORGH_AS_0510 TaxID=3041771 RepID=UPI002786A218|nr:HD-GYP domain-containing protein [Bacillus sp. SORGH_AS_0510]MDQ1147514.1 putative nucleotidyltransferase with HDIG domain [Bacillus sp. SORGH_AS_0510]
MNGLHLGENGKYLEKVIDSTSEFSLIAKGDGSEVILQTIKEGKTFYVFPGEEPETMEFFFIVNGECVYEEMDTKIYLKSGDYFYIHHLEDATYFKALTDMKLIWFTTQPAFHFISESINELTKIVKQVEEKDQYTYQHSARVQTYSVRIAKQLQLSKEKLENLYFASLFHDVGKIHVPEEILNKPGKLSNEEFEILKKHSWDGCEMVKSTYYGHIGDIILQHHERLDGSGYPSGLSGEEILLEAQIIGVADTYDAMTSDRVYRKGLDPKIAIAELKRLAGSHYRSEIVEAFEKVLIIDGKLKVEDLKQVP